MPNRKYKRLRKIANEILGISVRYVKGEIINPKTNKPYGKNSKIKKALDKATYGE